MGRVKRHHIDFFEILSTLYLLLLSLLVIIIAMQGDHSIFIVLVGFFPTILVIILSMIIHEQFANHKAWLWLMPVIINVAFYFIGTTTPVIAEQLSVDLLIGANFLLSIIYMIIVLSVFLDDFKKIVKEQEKEKPVEETKSLQDYIHSIEDKSKALNFVVGRVYSKYHGGSRDLRSKLRIPSDWYNEFSLLGVGTEQIDMQKLMELVNRFDTQLQLFTKSEKEIFGFESDNLKNLIRDTKGKDTIIDVMDRNDKDPARSYYAGAVDFCKKIKHEVQHNELQLVRNEYIPKDEDELAEIRGEEPKKNSPAKSSSKSVHKTQQQTTKQAPKKELDHPAPNHKPARPKHP